MSMINSPNSEERERDPSARGPIEARDQITQTAVQILEQAARRYETAPVLAEVAPVEAPVPEQIETRVADQKASSQEVANLAVVRAKRDVADAYTDIAA